MAVTYRTNEQHPGARREGDHVVVTEHAGLVVETGSFYLGDGDSNYWALVFDPVTDSFVQVGYCSTYCPGCDFDRGRENEGRCRAVVDAPEHLIRRVAEERRIRGEALARDRRIAAAESAFHTPRRGALVEVVAGRKVARGVRGLVFWDGDSQFGPRIGLELPDGGREFLAAHNVEVISRPGEPPHRCGDDPQG